jgi:hypothetical protein
MSSALSRRMNTFHSTPLLLSLVSIPLVCLQLLTLPLTLPLILILHRYRSDKEGKSEATLGFEVVGTGQTVNLHCQVRHLPIEGVWCVAL